MNLKSNKYFFEIQDYLMILLGTLLYNWRRFTVCPGVGGLFSDKCELIDCLVC